MYTVTQDDTMELLPEILNRTSVREFDGRPVPKDAMERILEAGSLAPSAKNRQPWRIVVVQEASRRAKLAEACYGEDSVKTAPAILAVCSTNIDYRMPNGHLSYPMDLALCADHMAFQALHEGLGTCFYSTYREEEIREILTVPYSMRVPLLLLIGYSAENSKKPKDRLPLSRIVSFEHW